ncbi:beta-glucosidase [Ideonella livida]|uniref:Glycoside hydrolase family 3 protein n=1 Tax=Ideonella livida TaxID=2707176 RepID=A0A7C9TN74_9BURK|nr:glycoside hydrolase family 3 C-terminal domain-containing protein [Ideonella livida]NDY93804.1 glycoside hydrolase family 3 protein [Ideonella livida]
MPQADARRLVEAMTLEEQVSLLSGADFWTTTALPHHGLPALKLTDGPNGARGSTWKDGPTTACFPVGIALAATWDIALVTAAGAALGREARLKGADVLLAPTINLQRTVYNGRNFECHSEDPWLASEMAVALVRGVQSEGVAATAKHFVGNESEHQRMTMSSQIPERALRELYLLPFERAVKEAGVRAVMTAYNRVDGEFMADHRRLLQQVLRDEWGFDGLVMTDWLAHHDTVASLLAGCDLEMPGPTRQRGAALIDAVRAGRVPAEAVAACAQRVVALAQRCGAMGRAALPAERADDLPAHRALIRRLGAAGAVLLKNEGGLLPLALQPGQTVALIGQAAVQPQIMGGGSATVNAHYRVAPQQALQAACPQVRFTHHVGAATHRFTPVYPGPMRLEFFAHADLSGPVLATQDSLNGEVMWLGSVPEGVQREGFHCRARLRYVAEASGPHVFSLISAGLSRACLNGEPVLDAWTGWQRGQTYFTFGCDEVRHQRHLQAGEAVDIELVYSSVTPCQAEMGTDMRALRLGVARTLGEAELDAAVQAARQADVAIVFAGLSAEWDNEGLDRPGLDLPHHQNALIARVAQANPRTVVVLQSGSPLLLPWLDAVPAVLQAWYPGQECGHAVADVLLGQAEPGGRLPQTWPARLADTVAFGQPAHYPGVDGRVHYAEGLFIGYRHHDARGLVPLFPFGHGLGYTDFAWEAVRVAAVAAVADLVAPACATGFEPLFRVEVDLRNTGQRPGGAVVQLYLAPLEDADPERPPQALAAFGRLDLPAGAQGTLALHLPARAFCVYDVARGAWVRRGGRHALRVGASSRDVRLQADLSLPPEPA